MRRRNSLDSYIVLFADSVIGFYRAREAGDVATANRFSLGMRKSYERIRQCGRQGREALSTLLDHPKDQVRLSAALRLMAYDVRRSRATMADVVDKWSAFQLEVEYCYRGWQAGNWSFDLPPPWFVSFQSNGSWASSSGIHVPIASPEAAPVLCTNCSIPLVPLLCLDATDERLELWRCPVPQLHLMYCWGCGVSGVPLLMRMSTEGTFSVVPGRVPRGHRPRSALAHVESPLAAQLMRVGEREAAVLRNVSLLHERGPVLRREHPDLFRIRHQIGGTPYMLPEEAQRVHCPVCETAMPFLASLCDELEDTGEFKENSLTGLHFYRCWEWHTLAAIEVQDW
jgi:hypothetical protein